MPLWVASAAMTIPAASAAPVPSPSRILRSRSGAFPIRFSTAAWAASAEHVSEQAVIDRARVERMEDRGRRGRHEPVNDDGHPLGARGDDRADHRCDLPPAEPAEHLQWLAVRPDPRDSRGDRVCLPLQPGVVDARAATDPVVGRTAIERMEDRRRHRRVGDPHLTKAEEIDAASHRLHAVGDRRRAGSFVEGVLRDNVGGRLVERQLEHLQAQVHRRCRSG